MIDLQAIRNAAGITQRELAERQGFTETSGRVSVAQLEARDDWLVSRIAAYLKACDATAELVVTVNGHELRFDV